MGGRGTPRPDAAAPTAGREPAAADADASARERARLIEALGVVLGRALRTGRGSALMMASVNGVAAVNARLGFEAGDALIGAVGGILKESIGAGDVLARYASNTFALVLDDCSETALEAAAERLAARVAEATVTTDAGPLAASICMGGVAMPAQATTVGEAIAGALGALEVARQGRCGGFALHRRETAAGRRASGDEGVAGAVISALEEGRLLLVLQPIVAAASGAVALYEGLLRLRRRDGTLSTAAEFVEEAETLGLARRIDRRALELGLGLIEAHPGLRLALNVSGLTAGDKDWIATLKARTAGRPELARRLVVEITETAMVHDLEAVRAFVEALHGLGCQVAIDDFGAGYTSFRHLRTLGVDMLKIDGAFVGGLPGGRADRVLVKTMIEMAAALGLETVAEWVTDADAAAFLKEAGVTYLQGFLYGAPAPVEELAQQGLL